MHHRHLAALFACSLGFTVSALRAVEPAVLPTEAATAPAPRWTATLSAEYGRFFRKSEFLGQEALATRTEDGLAGDLFGGTIGLEKAGSSWRFEFTSRAGELEADPLYTSSLGAQSRTAVTVDRREYEFGVRYKRPNYALRFGFYYKDEALENRILAANTFWAPAVVGRDSANPSIYRRSLSDWGGYVGMGFAWTKELESSVVGLKLDGDFRIGQLKSDVTLFTVDGEEAKALYGVPHRATFFISRSVGSGQIFTEAGFRGDYNFTSGGGVSGYDYGYFGRVGFNWSF